MDTPEPTEETDEETKQKSLRQYNRRHTRCIWFRTDEPDDEIVNTKPIPRADLPEEEDGLFAGDDEFDDDIGYRHRDDTEDDFEDDLGQDDDFDLDTSDFDVDTDLDTGDSIGVDVQTDMLSEMISELDLEEGDYELDLSEEELSEVEEGEEESINIADQIRALREDEDNLFEEEIEGIEEAVRVDFEPQKSGWAGTPESFMREYEEMLLAREQDSEVKEKNEELRKTVAALQKENKTLASVATKLEAQIGKYSATLETLLRKLETTNVSNAKLLYINRALENASLNERQKEKIVEAISKAETVQEAKIVFDTLQETITSHPAEKKRSSLSEAVSRRSTLLVAAREEQKQTAANPAFDRLQRLAGIKK